MNERTVEQLLSYLPPDRATAILSGGSLPEEDTGSVLFSDISGFTPLTEAVVARYGARRGGEEFTDRLNAVYDALIEQVERFGGSILGFAGDAMTAWFAGDDGILAATAGEAMQFAMQRFSRVELPDGVTVSLSMKVAISSGRLRRFTCGDPGIQLFDILAGDVMERLATCEGAAQRGEILVDEATAKTIWPKVALREWRSLGADHHPASAAVLDGINDPARPRPNERPALPDDAAERLRPWLIPEVFQRIQSGQNVFLTELRPASALFVRFSGIAFEADPEAPRKLDAYVRWIQAIVTRLEGVLIQLTVGDKGSYLYAAFGAPVAHDDDTARAMSAALEIVKPPAEIAAIVPEVQVGVTRGTMRTGAYGGRQRRTYGVLGDDVNLAARLMKAAKPNEILVSDRAARRLRDAFEFQTLDPIKVKGKSEPVAINRLVGRKRADFLADLRNQRYSTPMIGRQAELAAVRDKLGHAARGQGQVVCLSADAGMGKTRLLSEIIRSAVAQGFSVFAGDCPVLAREASYTVWAPIWRSLLELGSHLAPDQVLASLVHTLRSVQPGLEERAPLWGPVLNVALPDNDLTRTLDGKVRRESMEAMLVECLRHRCARSPVVLVLEEAHWIDEASRHLLKTIIQAIARMPVAIVLAHRPVAAGDLLGAAEAALDYVRTIELGDLPAEDARQLTIIRLKDVFGQQAAVPESLVDLIATRASGNPFFIEEVANLLKTRNIDLTNQASLESLELPASLHSLVLGRIDQMSGTAQTTLKVASVIGRLFRAAMLWGVHPLERDRLGIDAHVREMCEREIALPEPVDGEEAYFFKHIVIQEVAYESLPFALRSTIHEAIGSYIEGIAGQNTHPWIDLLAFHFDRSSRDDKKRIYLVAAGDAAKASYANRSAINYYQRVLPILEGADRIAVLAKLGPVMELTGAWDGATACYEEGLRLAEAAGQVHDQARCAAGIGDLLRRRTRFTEAADWLKRAIRLYEAAGDRRGMADILHLRGTLSAQTGDFPKAAELYQRALAIRHELGLETDAARTLNNLGIVSRAQGDSDTALVYYERSLEIRRRLNDRRELANSLNNVAIAHRFRGDYERAREMLEESLKLYRVVGDRWSVGNGLHSLAELALDREDTALAAQCLKESISINRDLGDRRELAFLLEGFGHLGRLHKQGEAALLFFAAAHALRAAIGAPLEPADAEKLKGVVDAIRAGLDAAAIERAEASGRKMLLAEVLDLAVASFT
jgi:predicted ATPase/class 3 adenylate cyclase